MKLHRIAIAGLLALLAFTAMPSIAAAEAGIAATGSAKSYDVNATMTAVTADAHGAYTATSSAAPEVAASGVLQAACHGANMTLVLNDAFLELARTSEPLGLDYSPDVAHTTRALLEGRSRST